MASYKILHKYVESYFEISHFQIEPVKLPRKWEKYGDFILFDRRLLNEQKDIEYLPYNFWQGVCSVLKCSRIGVKDVITNNGHRTPQVTIIYGTDPWIYHVDNGVKYCWNVRENMFSAGNAPERHRIAKLDCRDKVIVDMFAGIGYFTLPYLVHAKAKFVHACEWNPAAVIALKRALALNNVDNRCVIYEGDNNLTCPVGVADRVNLGLIPSSEASWRKGCQALKETGGTMAIHGTVETMKLFTVCPDCNVDGDRTTFKWKHENWFLWSCHVLHCIASLMADVHSSNYQTSIEWVHFVKSYAPHVDHLVLDVKVESS